MLMFSVSTFVLFHFGLDRGSLAGDLAAGVLWVTLLLAAVLGMNRLFVAEREQGGFDGFLMAPVDRTALFVAKAAVLFGFLVAVELVAVPAFVDPAARARPRPGAARAARRAAARRRGDRGRRHADRRARRPDAGARPDRPADGAAAARAGRDRRRRGDARRCSRRAARTRSQGAGWLVLALYDAVFGLLAYAVFDFLLEE